MSITGMVSFLTSGDQSYGLRMYAPIWSSSFGNSSGCGAMAAYDLYIGVDQAAMKEQQRLATAVDRVVVVHTVDCGMAAFGGFGYCIFHSWFLLRGLNDRRGREAAGDSRKDCDALGHNLLPIR